MPNKLKSYNLQPGFSLVEVILAIAIFALLASGLFGSYLYGQEASMLAGYRARGAMRVDEGLEAARNMRDAGFGNLAAGTYGLSQAGNQWSFAGVQDVADIFTRQTNVVSIDSRRALVTATVTWQQNAQRSGSASAVTRFTDWQRSIGDWSNSTLEGTFDLTVANSGNNNADGRSIATAGNLVYVGRTNSAGREFYIFDVSDPSAPLLVGSRDLNGNPNGIVIRGNYAYVGSDDNAQELQIIDISDSATIANPGKLTSVDLTVANSGNNNANGTALAIAGSYLLMTRDAGDGFLIFDLSNPSAPGNPIGRVNTITGIPSDVAVSGNYAYVSSDDNAAELQVVDITNKVAPSRVAVFDLNSGNANANALSVAVDGSYVLVGRAASAAPELYSLSIAVPTAPSLSSTLELNANVRKISVDPNVGYVFLATSDLANDVQIVNATDPSTLGTPPPLGRRNINDGPLAIVYSALLNRAFIASSFNAEELQIVRPQ